MTEAEVIAIIQNYMQAQQRVRIPELPDAGVTGDVLSLDDRLPLWRAADNKTVQTNLEILKAFLINSSDQVVTPTLMGDTFFATAGVSEAGTNTFNIPSISGKEFQLRRNNYGGLEVGVDYEILSSGGFKLLPDTNVIFLGEKFELELKSDQPVTPGGTVSGTSLFTGAVVIASTQTLNAANHQNKLIQLRPNAVSMVTSLAKIEDVPENSIWLLEASIAQYESKIATTAGQYLYINGTSALEVSIRPGEFLWAYRGADGYYVFNFHPGIFQVAKQVMWGYSVDDDEIEVNGGVYSKAIYNRFYNTAKVRFAASWCTEEQWNTPSENVGGIVYEYPYRGFFVDIDATTFRVPDLSGTTIRTLKTRTSGIPDTPRHSSNPGGLQMDELKSHKHTRNPTGGVEPNMTWPALGGGGDFNGGSRFPINLTDTGSTGGSETRMINIGLRAKMKV